MQRQLPLCHLPSSIPLRCRWSLQVVVAESTIFLCWSLPRDVHRRKSCSVVHMDKLVRGNGATGKWWTPGKYWKVARTPARLQGQGKVPRECCEKVEWSKPWANFSNSDPEKCVIFTWVLDSSWEHFYLDKSPCGFKDSTCVWGSIRQSDFGMIRCSSHVCKISPTAS